MEDRQLLNNLTGCVDVGEGPEEDKNDREYFLEEFGKLQLPYYPTNIGLFSGSNSVTYILMTMKNELIVFIIQAIMKKKQRVANNPALFHKKNMRVNVSDKNVTYLNSTT